MHTRAIALIVLLTAYSLAGCGGGDGGAAQDCTDKYRDGYAVEGGSCGRVDCDDTNAAVYPGAQEGPFEDATCGDTEDNDCDGYADAADTGCQSTVQCDNDSDCDDGLFCNGPESCQEGQCLQGSIPCPDDGVFCNGTESCNESLDQCSHSGSPCPDDGVFCNGTETCNEPTDQCAHSGDPCPDDGLFCNGTESCDEVNDRCAHSGMPCTSDGNPCTADTCDETGDVCLYLCSAAHPDDPCCSDPACSGDPVCEEEPEFPGGLYQVKIVGIAQQPAQCLLPQALIDLLQGIAGGIYSVIYLPAQSEYPLWLTLQLPLLGTIQVYARFEDDQIVLEPVTIEGIDIVKVVPSEFQWIVNLFRLNCMVGGTAGGVFDQLSAASVSAQITLDNIEVQQGSGSGQCSLQEPQPDCTLFVDLQGTASTKQQTSDMLD